MFHETRKFIVGMQIDRKRDNKLKYKEIKEARRINKTKKQQTKKIKENQIKVIQVKCGLLQINS